MKRTLLVALFCCIYLCIQTVSAQVIEGNYAGIMHLAPKTLDRDSIPVVLEISRQNDSAFRLVMIYDSAMTKDYLFILGQNGIVLDEQNGILLPGAPFNQGYIFHYSVNERQYHTRYEWKNDSTLLFKLDYFSPADTIEIDDLIIQGYHFKGRQYAILRKID